MNLFEGLPDINIHYSSIIGIAIYNEQNQKIGKVKDVFVDFEEMYPQVIALQFKKNSQLFYINWQDVIQFNFFKIIIKNEAELGRSRTLPRITTRRSLTGQIADQFKDNMVEYPPLGKVILDRQIVDTSGKKVVRVNDLELVKAGQHLRVTHAAIGLRSMIRRLGYEWLFDNLLTTIYPKSIYLKKEPLINWKYVHAIPDKSIHRHVSLNLKNEDIQKLHPADLADILEDLDNHSREVIFSNLSPELAAATLSEVESDIQIELLKNEEPEEVAKIIENMGVDEAVDVLSEMEEEHASEIIANIEDDSIQEDIQDLLEYEEDSAGGLMSTSLLNIFPHLTKKEVLEAIKDTQQEFENLHDLFVIDENGKLIGHTALSKLLIQPDDTKLESIMNRSDLKYLQAETHWHDLARYMSKYNLISVPIVSVDQKLIGIVSVDDVLPWLLDEK